MGTTLDRLKGMDINEARLSRDYPPGTIGVVSADLSRYAIFSACLLATKYPYGSSVVWRTGADIVNSCNKLVKEFTGDWLWFLGDDHVWDTNLLLQLLDRMYGDPGVDMIAANVRGRKAPFPSVAAKVDRASRNITLFRAQELRGLTPVDVVGSAGLLVRRRVFDAIPYPHFEAGSVIRDGLGEDWKFCLNAANAGFQAYVDADAPLGHIITGVVWPNPEGAQVDLGDKIIVTLAHKVLEGATVQAASVA